MNTDVKRCETCWGRGWIIDRYTHRDTICPLCQGKGGYRVRIKQGKIAITSEWWDSLRNK